jgi:hypothetical protein
MRKKLFGIFVAVACICFLTSCRNEPTKQSVSEQKIQIQIHLTVDGNKASFEKGSPHIGEKGKTLVPLDFFNRYLGANVNWNREAQTIDIKKNKTNIELKVGESQAMVDGKALSMACPVGIEGGVVMVPIRVASEALGATVGWDDATHEVSVVTAGTKPH